MHRELLSRFGHTDIQRLPWSKVAWLLSKLAAKRDVIHVVLVFQACSHGNYHQEFEKSSMCCQAVCSKIELLRESP